MQSLNALVFRDSSEYLMMSFQQEQPEVEADVHWQEEIQHGSEKGVRKYFQISFVGWAVINKCTGCFFLRRLSHCEMLDLVERAID